MDRTQNLGCTKDQKKLITRLIDAGSRERVKNAPIDFPDMQAWCSDHAVLCLDKTVYGQMEIPYEESKDASRTMAESAVKNILLSINPGQTGTTLLIPENFIKQSGTINNWQLTEKSMKRTRISIGWNGRFYNAAYADLFLRFMNKTKGRILIMDAPCFRHHVLILYAASHKECIFILETINPDGICKNIPIEQFRNET